MNADISKTIKDRELGELSKIESWDFRTVKDRGLGFQISIP